MKRIIASLLIFAVVFSFFGCTTATIEDSAAATESPDVSSAATEAVSKSYIKIGNFLYGDSLYASAETLSDSSFRITLDEGVYLAVVTADVSKLDEADVKDYLSALSESLYDESEQRYGEFTFDIPLPGLPLVGTYYMQIDENNDSRCYVDCLFTDSWYAYCIKFLCDTDVPDISEASSLFGRFLAGGTYSGKAHRFDPTQINTNINETEPPTTTPSETEPPTTQPPETEPPVTESKVTTGMRNALSSAKSYLRFMAFSYGGLIDQLEYEGYTNDEAIYAADNCGADWNEQALKSAKDYLDFTAFSYTGLIDQLEYEQFTPSQAKYAVDNCGADWNEQAAKSAEDYLDFMSFSRSGLIEQLMYEGFTREQAEYGADSVGLT